ncbi:E3 ubiquitin ligase PQT3-like isoform X1 [Solanum stenotomum]|uniref:E3 ubiquitin ligase PQT3-like isoform X1 n=1 Tax=Solanum stenotomum TaxID=172797 RepID=UPI0020D0A122|nr:E3 ubiquitin ligase PQT3-like isoform X1 [Solanum stenotomum]XP_049377963.1 E3 ubiquitin ligase PQT3-like isoform X1 [Solanum stenotomum]
MSIRFKFRSCLNFDSVDIDGRTSISLGELMLKIARLKKLNIGQDFDLVFSDALSGEVYNDESIQIASGSSVIIRRVPAGMTPSTVKPPIGTMKDLGLKDVDRMNQVDAQVNEFHDFGADFFPLAEGFDQQNYWDFEKEYLSGPRFQYQNLDSRGLNQAIQRGFNHSKIPTKLPELKTPDARTLHKVIHSNFPAFRNNVLPDELKCPLCNIFSKDAVMIPCCQHSFCEKCIRLVLLEKAKCPKCSSSRCRVEDLLPNISLRQTIEHFLATESENALRRHVPDGESGNQVKDICCAVTVAQRKPEMPHSPSATGKGSNQVMVDPPVGKKALSRIMQQIDGGRGQYANHWNFPNIHDDPEYFEAESKPLNLLHSHDQDEDSSIKKNTGLWCDTRGGNMNFPPAGIMEDPNCYVYGSPEHVNRVSALASNPNPMLQTGNLMLTGGFPTYSSPYWNNNTYSTPRPFANMYDNAGNASFNAGMVPPAPAYVPPYMPSMHAGMPLHGEIMRMDGMALPAGNRDDLPLNQYEYMGAQLAEENRRIQNEKMGSGQYCQAESNFKEHFPKDDREATGKFHKEREPGTNCSEDRFARKTHRKQLNVEERREKSHHSSSASRDKVARHSDRSNDGFPSSSDRRRREIHQHHFRDSRKRHERDSHHKHIPSSALEPTTPVHQMARSKERRGFGHDAKHSRHHARRSTDEVRDNKKSGSYEDCRDGYHHKRKRDH